jgi:hypothetical protein
VLAERHLPEPKMKLTDTGSDILLRRSPPPHRTPPPLIRPTQPSRAVRRPIQIAPEPRTVPVMTSVAAPPPTPAPLPAVRATRWQRIVRTMMVDSGWLLLWVGAAIGLSLIIGGFSASIAESASTPTFAGVDRAGGVVGVALLAICGLLIGRRIQRVRKNSHRWPPLSELSPALDSWLSRVRLPLLIIGLLFCFGLALTGILTPPGPNDPGTMSSLAYSVILVCLFGQGTAACGYGLYRRWHPRKLVADLANGKGTPPAMP